jgi:hypothetical protein
VSFGRLTLFQKLCRISLLDDDALVQSNNTQEKRGMVSRLTAPLNDEC